MYIEGVYLLEARERLGAACFRLASFLVIRDSGFGFQGWGGLKTLRAEARSAVRTMLWGPWHGPPSQVPVFGYLGNLASGVQLLLHGLHFRARHEVPGGPYSSPMPKNLWCSYGGGCLS